MRKNHPLISDSKHISVDPYGYVQQHYSKGIYVYFGEKLPMLNYIESHFELEEQNCEEEGSYYLKFISSKQFAIPQIEGQSEIEHVLQGLFDEKGIVSIIMDFTMVPYYKYWTYYIYYHIWFYDNYMLVKDESRCLYLFGDDSDYE